MSAGILAAPARPSPVGTGDSLPADGAPPAGHLGGAGLPGRRDGGAVAVDPARAHAGARRRPQHRHPVLGPAHGPRAPQPPALRRHVPVLPVVPVRGRGDARRRDPPVEPLPAGRRARLAERQRQPVLPPVVAGGGPVALRRLRPVRAPPPGHRGAGRLRPGPGRWASGRSRRGSAGCWPSPPPSGSTGRPTSSTWPAWCGSPGCWPRPGGSSPRPPDAAPRPWPGSWACGCSVAARSTCTTADWPSWAGPWPSWWGGASGGPARCCARRWPSAVAMALGVLLAAPALLPTLATAGQGGPGAGDRAPDRPRPPPGGHPGRRARRHRQCRRLRVRRLERRAAHGLTLPGRDRRAPGRGRPRRPRPAVEGPPAAGRRCRRPRSSWPSPPCPTACSTRWCPATTGSAPRPAGSSSSRPSPCLWPPSACRTCWPAPAGRGWRSSSPPGRPRWPWAPGSPTSRPSRTRPWAISAAGPLLAVALLAVVGGAGWVARSRPRLARGGRRRLRPGRGPVPHPAVVSERPPVRRLSRHGGERPRRRPRRPVRDRGPPDPVPAVRTRRLDGLRRRRRPRPVGPVPEGLRPLPPPDRRLRPVRRGVQPGAVARQRRPAGVAPARRARRAHGPGRARRPHPRAGTGVAVADEVEPWVYERSTPGGAMVVATAAPATEDEMWARVAARDWDPAATAAVLGPRPHRHRHGGTVTARPAPADRELWDVDAPAGGFLRVGARWDPGWSATVDGRTGPGPAGRRRVPGGRRRRPGATPCGSPTATPRRSTGGIWRRRPLLGTRVRWSCRGRTKSGRRRQPNDGSGRLDR